MINWGGIDPLLRGDFRALEKATDHCYLTGSRFFGNQRQDSDYDFFAQYSKELENYLQNIGFTKIKKFSNYGGDPMMLSVWEGPSGLVHVQLVKDCAIKRRVQQILKHSKLLPVTEQNKGQQIKKEEEKRMWITAWLLVSVGGYDLQR